MSTNAEVLISLGGSQYIVKVDQSIPAGEIHIGRFAALDALVEATGQVAQPAPVAKPVLVQEHRRVRPGRPEEPTFYMLRVREEEQTAAREWLHKNGHTLNEMERKVMDATFPPNKIGMVGSAAVADAVGIGPAPVRRIRNAVLRRAGVLNR